MDVDACLARIGAARPEVADREALRELHVRFLLAVPFETLDIGLGRQVVCELPAIYRKVVERGRGGFCYELNGLFAWLLEALGFPVQRLAARVFHDDGTLGPRLDHLLLRVEAEETWMADVGFGDSFVTPLRLTPGESEQPGATYRVTYGGETWRLERRQAGEPWEPQYAFELEERRLADFAPMCRWQQESADSAFHGRWTCSIAREDGRDTIAGRRFLSTRGGERSEREIADPRELRERLAREFAIEIEEAGAERLFAAGGAPR